MSRGDGRIGRVPARRPLPSPRRALLPPERRQDLPAWPGNGEVRPQLVLIEVQAEHRQHRTASLQSRWPRRQERANRGCSYAPSRVVSAIPVEASPPPSRWYSERTRVGAINGPPAGVERQVGAVRYRIEQLRMWSNRPARRRDDTRHALVAQQRGQRLAADQAGSAVRRSFVICLTFEPMGGTIATSSWPHHSVRHRTGLHPASRAAMRGNGRLAIFSVPWTLARILQPVAVTARRHDMRNMDGGLGCPLEVARVEDVHSGSGRDVKPRRCAIHRSWRNRRSPSRGRDDGSCRDQ
jgi:hypothetical protein